MRRHSIGRCGERGSALLVALWAVIILSLLVGGFAFEMQVESQVVSHARKRMKALYLARAGVEWAKMVIARREDINEADAEAIEDAENAAAEQAALRLLRGIGLTGEIVELGDGSFTVDMVPENSKRNINKLNLEEWEELLDVTGVPADRWPEIIDCFNDWVDKNDLHLLNGAEQDDPYYEERGIRVKNAAMDTVGELLLIKSIDEAVLYGGPGEDEDDPPLTGIAQHLTTWGDGKVNINNASREVLLTLTDLMDDFWVDAIIDFRMGEDGEPGSSDDGFKSIDEALTLVPELERVQRRITVEDISYLRVTSVGEVQGVRNTIWCILRVEGKEALPVYWREGG